MAHQEGQQNDHMADSWLSAFEEECLEDLESSETNMEDNVQRDTDFAMQKLFLQFQNSATAIAQLYKGSTNVNVFFFVGWNFYNGVGHRSTLT